MTLPYIISAEEKKESDEKKTDEKKMPVDFGLEFAEEFQFDSIGKKPGTNYGWSDVYLKSRGKFSAAFPIKFYTITPWVQDAVELPMMLGNPVAVNTKNNFYFGLDNNFVIENIMNIGANFEFRMGNCLGINPVTGTNDDLEIRLSPVLNLSGSYNFGLSWSVSQYF